MFMRQRRNETVSSLEQMRLLSHCEIQWEALEFSEEHKWLCDNLKPNRRNTVQRDSH